MTAGGETIFFIPLRHHQKEVRTLVGKCVGERLERFGSLGGDHVEEHGDAVSASRVGKDRPLLVGAEVVASTQSRQDGGDV